MPFAVTCYFSFSYVSLDFYVIVNLGTMNFSVNWIQMNVKSRLDGGNCVNRTGACNYLCAPGHTGKPPPALPLWTYCCLQINGSFIPFSQTSDNLSQASGIERSRKFLVSYKRN